MFVGTGGAFAAQRRPSAAPTSPDVSVLAPAGTITIDGLLIASAAAASSFGTACLWKWYTSVDNRLRKIKQVYMWSRRIRVVICCCYV
jgi:hypothetical protein